MTGGTPRRPSGASPQAKYFQWVWDSLVLYRRPGSVRGARVSSTTGGVFVEPISTGNNGGGDSRARQYVLTAADRDDYFICRTLGTRTDKSDPENPVTLPAIGAMDVFIAKPFHLRRFSFDRDILNAETPGSIGTVDEITYDVQVESWDGSTLSETTLRASYEYKSATFRLDTNATDPDPDNWTTQKQTIIPRFVPAVLVEPEDGPVTTETVTPTIIYADRCSGLDIQTSEADGAVEVNLLARSDGWAWSRTA